MTSHDDDQQALDFLIRGFEISRAIRLVADLAIADKIAPGALRGVADIASECNVLAFPLTRLLRTLAAFGVFRIDADGNVAHSPRSLLLRTDVPNSLHYGARHWAASGSWRAWEDLDVALKGSVPHETAWGMPRFAYLREHPDEARIFDAFMANFPDDRHNAIAAAYDFSSSRLVADIGGGNGETLRRILARFPDTQGVVFDREDVVEAIPADMLVSGRLKTQGGSFFDTIPSGADHYLLVRVLNNWPDENALRILRACRAVVTVTARLLIGEQILEPDPSRGHPTDYLIDLQMMAMFGSARTRTEAEFRELLAQAGFDLRRVIATNSPVSILEATPR